MEFDGKVAFCIGTGRCGTLFLHELIAREPEVASSHERNPDNETFHRFCQWHDLPVDHGGFLAVKEREIREDLAARGFSFEASPYLSLSVRQLHERFGARFVLLVRRPDRVVTSFVHKGFYKRSYSVDDVNLATGYQDQSPEKIHTFFARIAPRGEFFRTWNAMSPVGKVAWFWQAWNARSMELLQTLPTESYRIVRIEDFDHATYVDTARFMGFEPKVGAVEFSELSESKPHAFWSKRNVDQWSMQEVAEFEAQVEPLARHFGYEHRIERLVAEAKAERTQAQELGHVPAKAQGPQFWRLRNSTAGWLRSLGNGLCGVADEIDVK